MLDSLLGEFAFDPLAFARMSPKEQFDELRRFVPTVDFDAIDKANKADFDRRADFNKFAKQERAAAAVIVVPPDTQGGLIEEQALVEQLQAAGDTNTDIARRKANRQRLSGQIEQLRATAFAAISAIATDHAALHAKREQTISDLEAQIDVLNQKLEATKLQYQVDYEAVKTKRAAEATAARDQADNLQGDLDAAAPLPAVVDTAELSRQIELARKANENARKAPRDPNPRRLTARRGRNEAARQDGRRE